MSFPATATTDATPSYLADYGAATLDGPMTEGQLSTLIGQLISQNDDSLGATSGGVRRDAIRSYHGLPYGNEIEGHSQVILTDVLDTVEWIMPTLIDMLIGSGMLWKFGAQEPADRAGADQATDIVNTYFFEYMDGEATLIEMVKTALIERVGHVRTEFTETVDPSPKTYRGLTEEELGALLTNNPDYEVVALEEHVGGETVVDIQTGGPLRTADITIANTAKRARIATIPIPPEEFSISLQDTRCNDETMFANHRSPMTISELVRRGYDYEVLKRLPEEDDLRWGGGTRIYRHWEYPARLGSQVHRPDVASRKVWVNHSFMRVDYDGDGFSEMRMVVSVGTSTPVVLGNEVVNWNPFASITPIPVPHRFEGLGVHDLVGDIQLMRSMFARNLMDNMYQANNVRFLGLEGQYDVDALLDSTPGGVVNVDSLDAVTPLPVPPLPPHAFDMLGFLKQEQQSRTGVSDWMSGPQPSSLKHQTSGGISQMQTASSAKIRMIARVMAGSGLKQLGKNILRAMTENFSKKLTMEVKGRWLTVDPSSWPQDMHCEVEVGLGAGESQERVANLMLVAEWQDKMVSKGLTNIVSQRNVYETAKAACEAMGFKSEGRFFTDPLDAQWPQPEPALADKVKVMESQRRKEEDLMDNQRGQLGMLVEAESNDQLARFRWAELEQKRKLEEERLVVQRETAEAQIEAQIRTAMIQQANQGRAA